MPVTRRFPYRLSRRQALAGIAASMVWRPGFSDTAPVRAPAENDGGPGFSSRGPDAELYGAAEGYPILDPSLSFHPLNPTTQKYRVGAFSHLDSIFKTREIARAATPWRFKRSPLDIQYTYGGTSSSLADYLARNPVTGLLIAKDDEILFEHYQYGRTDRDRLASQSMAKSIVGLLIGIAISEGSIQSVDDTPDRYVQGFKGTEYGRTSIRDLLHMSSGVEFGEEADNNRDLDRLAFDLMGGYIGHFGKAKWAPSLAARLGAAKGTVASIVQFNRRIAPPGTRYFYASIEVDVLAMVLRHAVGKSVSEYLHDKIWEPIGAEADASWLVDAEGFEVAYGFFNATLRDYGRLGRLLAHDGIWNGKQIIPARWMIDATTVRVSDAFLAPGKAQDPAFGYGYLLWLLPSDKRQFALFGNYGQRICIDPASKLVMVHTSVEAKTEIWRLWSALVKQFGQA